VSVESPWQQPEAVQREAFSRRAEQHRSSTLSCPLDPLRSPPLQSAFCIAAAERHSTLARAGCTQRASEEKDHRRIRITRRFAWRGLTADMGPAAQSKL